MIEKRFRIIGDSNIEYLMQSKLLLPIYDKEVRLNLKSCCDLLNELDEMYVDEYVLRETVQLELQRVETENEQLKQDKKRLVGYLHRYGKVDVEDIDEVVLNQEYLDEWGELYGGDV